MTSLIGKLLDYDQGSEDTLRVILEQQGFKQIATAVSNHHDLTFDEGKISPDQVVVIGYDKDLNLNFDDWFALHQEKQGTESMSIYTQAIDAAAKNLGPRTHIVYTSSGQVCLPTLDKPVQYVSLPFQRKEFTLAITVERNLTLPTELLCGVYVGRDAAMDYNSRLTLPVAFFTVRGQEGIEYLMISKELEEVIQAQKEYVKDNYQNAAIRKTVHHTQAFINKYKKLVKK